MHVTSIATKNDDDGSDSMALRDVIRVNGALADATRSILDSKDQQVTIRHLSLRFYLRFYDCLSIAGAVDHAMATQKVGTAEFAILTEKEDVDCTDADLLYFAKQFNRFMGACTDAFAGLTRLQIENMTFGESDIPNILSTCKRLESLRLSRCSSGIRTLLQVEHAKLIELEVCYGTSEIIELKYVPKLQRMTHESWLSHEGPLSFGYVPQLSYLCLINTGTSRHKALKLSQFLAEVPSITDLHLNFESEKPECPKLLAPVLNKLWFVNLVDLPEGCDIAWMMFIVKAARSLKELCITVWDHWCDLVGDEKIRRELGYCKKANVEWESSASDLKHQNLDVLTIFGFQPDDYHLTYIRNVMEPWLT